MNNVLEQLEKLCKENNMDMYDIRTMLQKETEEKMKVQNKNEYESHRVLIGKCYKFNDKYYKVISIKADHNARVSCLVFPEHPKYVFEPLCRMSNIGCEYEGDIYLEGIRVEDPMVRMVLECMEEIPEGEYRYAYHRFCNELIDLEMEDYR